MRGHCADAREDLLIEVERAMDCEKFDQHVIDALYDELDELTHAALKRHVEGCSRCAGILSGLRATREVGILPIEEPSADLEGRILDAVAAAQRKTPWPRKLLRGLAWAGSHAMRPQLAMAALFFLVIGSSLLLLRAKPGTVVAPVRVTENGAPTPEQAEPAAAGTVALDTPPMATASPAESPMAAAEAKSRDDGAKDKDSAKAEIAEKTEKDAAKLALDDARAVRGTSGCAAAVSKFDEVGTRFPGSGAAADAMWEAAACYKSMGEIDKAHQLYLALKGTGSYRDRAQQELAADNNNFMQNQVAARAAAAAPPPPAAAPTAAPPAASVASTPPPAKAGAAEAQVKAAKPGSGSMGSSGKANAAPKRPVSSDAAGF